MEENVFSSKTLSVDSNMDENDLLVSINLFQIWKSCQLVSLIAKFEKTPLFKLDA